MLKRLESVKSTVPGKGAKAKAKPGPPRAAKSAPKDKPGPLVQPEWKD
jgi:hypothetical protein